MSDRRFRKQESPFKATLRHYHVPKSKHPRRSSPIADQRRERISWILRVAGITTLIAILIIVLVSLFVQMSV